MKTLFNTFMLGLLLTTILNLGANAQNVGDIAPNFTLDKLDGGSFTLSEQSGKVVFIFLFGNGCPHCISNGPNTETDIYNVYKSNPNFVAIGIDTWDGNSGSVASYKSTTGISYPLLLDGSGVQTAYSTTFDRIIIVGADGKIKYKSTTNADKGTTAAASAVISNLLEGTSSIVNDRSDSKQFLLAPNRVENQLIVSNPFGENQQVKLEIIDLAGKVVFSKTGFDLSHENYLDISALNSGVFTLVLRSENDFRVAKFVKVN